MLYTKLCKKIKAILATARGEDITAINQDVSVAAQGKLDKMHKIFLEI